MSIEQEFIKKLEGLARRKDEDPQARATLAKLRRGLGKTPGDTPEMYPFVQPLIWGIGKDDEDRFYLVAALFASHQISWSASDETSSYYRNMGESLRRFTGAKREAAKSTERRFAALLQCDRNTLPNHLHHAVALLKTAELPIDWGQLLWDIARWEEDETKGKKLTPIQRDWERERKPAQRSWARAFWQDAIDTEQNDPDADSDETLNEEGV